jgi:hypothetical protein
MLVRAGYPSREDCVPIGNAAPGRVAKNSAGAAPKDSARRIPDPLLYFFAAACFSRNSLIICSCVARGTGWYLANSIENSPLPWVAERRSVE